MTKIEQRIHRQQPSTLLFVSRERVEFLKLPTGDNFHATNICVLLLPFDVSTKNKLLAIKTFNLILIIAQTSAHYQFRYRSCLRLIIRNYRDKKMIFRSKSHFLVPKKQNIRCKEELYLYWQWAEV